MATTRMDSTAITLSACATQARAWESTLRSDLIRAAAPGVAVRDALNTLVSALDAITQAKADATRVAGDPTRTSQYKVDAIKKSVGASFDDALGAAEALGRAMDNARDAFTRKIMPARPAGASDALLAFKAQEVAKALEHAHTHEGVPILAASSLLADALASDDKELVYILCSGPMSITYKRTVSNPAKLMAELARVLGESNAIPSTGAAALIPVLSAGGSGTLRSLVDGARFAVGKERDAYNAWLLASARTGALNGVWQVGGKSLV